MPPSHDVPLFDPSRHEPLAGTPWSERAARAAIDRIRASAGVACTLWNRVRADDRFPTLDRF